MVYLPADIPIPRINSIFPERITNSFKIGFNYQILHLKSARKNLESACSHPEVEHEYLRTEFHMGRVVGPLANSMKLKTHSESLRGNTKSHQPNKWRLTIDLLHPVGLSVNDSIPKHLSFIKKYITIDNAIQDILRTLC